MKHGLPSPWTGKWLPTDIVIELIDPNWLLEINEPMNQGRHGQWVSCSMDSLGPWFPWKLVSLVSTKPAKMVNGCHGNNLSSPRGTWGTRWLDFEVPGDQGILMARKQLNEEPWQDR